MKLQEIVVLELRALFRRQSPMVLLLLGIPALYSVLFGWAYGGNVIKYVPTVIYDQDQTAASRALIQAYADSERYRIVAQVTTQEAMEEWLCGNEALAAIAIPPRFAQDIKNGRGAEVLIETNSTNNMFANAVIASSQEIIQTVSAATGQKLLEVVNQMPDPALRSAAPVKMGIRLLNNPTGAYTGFMLPGLAANGLQIAILLLAGTLIVKEYNNLSFWQGTSSAAIVVGKLLPCWLCATASFLVYIGIITTCFKVPLRGDPGSLLLLGSAFTFLVTNLSLLFSALAGNEVAALQVPLLYIMPGLLFSGLSWPELAMNDAARGFSALMPLTYMADVQRDLLLSGTSPVLVKNVLLLLTGGSCLGVVTIAVFSWRRKKIRLQPEQEASL